MQQTHGARELDLARADQQPLAAHAAQLGQFVRAARPRQSTIRSISPLAVIPAKAGTQNIERVRLVVHARRSDRKVANSLRVAF